MASREEEVKVKVTGADQGARDLDKLGGTAKVAGESVKGMGKEADKASKGVDELGDEAKETASQLSALERQIIEAKVALNALGAELSRTADKQVAVEYDKQSSALAKMESRARSIKKLAEELAPKNQGRDATIRGALGDLFGILPSLASGGQALSTLSNVAGAAGGPALGAIKTGALIGGGAAATVPLLAGATGGILGGVGLGVVGAGIAGAASQSASVGESFNATLDKLEARFKKATTSWIAPSVAAVHTLDDAIKQIPLESVLKSGEKYIEPLSKGLSGLLVGATGGLDQLVKDAEPVVNMLSTSLPKLGKSIGDAERVLGTGAAGGADALGDILDLAGGLTKAFAGAAAGAGQLYKTLEDTPVFGQGHDLFMKLFDFKDLPETVARQLHGVADSEAEMARQAAEAKQRFDDLKQAFDDSIHNSLDSVQANVALQRAQDDLTEGFKRGKNALDASSESGRQNIELATAFVKAAQQQRDAAIAAGDGSAVATAKANAAYQTQISNLEGILVKLGLSKDEAHKFAQQFMGLDGMTATVKVNVKYQEYNPGIALGNLLHHAGGRRASDRAGWAVVGENGPELAYFSQGDRVWSNPQSQAMLSGAGAPASSYGGYAAPQLPPMSVIEQALAAVVVRLMQDGALPVPATAVR